MGKDNKNEYDLDGSKKGSNVDNNVSGLLGATSSGLVNGANSLNSAIQNNDMVQTIASDAMALEGVRDVLTNREYEDNAALTVKTYSMGAATALGVNILNKYEKGVSGAILSDAAKKTAAGAVQQGITNAQYEAYMADSGKTTTDFFAALSDKKIFLGTDTVSYSKEGMKALANAFTDMFNRFATSYEWVNDVVNKVLQAGENSGIQSNVYGVDLKKFWDDNAKNYESFRELAGTWVDLIKYTIEQNDEVIQEVLAEYNRKVS